MGPADEQRVADGIVYVGTQSAGLFALNAKTGAIVWSDATPLNASSSPAVAKGIVYIGSGQGMLFAFDASTGVQRWATPLDQIVLSSPAVGGGVVYVGSAMLPPASGGDLNALDAATGKLLWQSPVHAFIFSSPALPLSNKVVYVGSDDGNLYAFNAATGAPRWSFQTGGLVDSSPAITRPADESLRARARTRARDDNCIRIRDHVGMPFPCCSAVLRDGRPCRRTVAAESGSFCVHHAALEAELGAEVLRRGRYPARKKLKPAAMPVVVGTSAAATETVEGDSVHSDPARVRPGLAEAAAASFDDIRRTLLDAATSASKPAWVEFECAECGTRRRVDVPVADVRTRVAAIELLLREGLGRAPQAEEKPATRLPENAAAIGKMSWHEMQSLAATLMFDDLVAAHRRGAATVLRERVAALPESERRVLRDALAEAV